PRRDPPAPPDGAARRGNRRRGHDRRGRSLRGPRQHAGARRQDAGRTASARLPCPGKAHAADPRALAAYRGALRRKRMADVFEEIEREIRDNQVLIYMKGTPSFPMCGFSAATVRVLNEIGVPFKAVDILAEPEKREAIKRYSNWPTIPQVFVGG